MQPVTLPPLRDDLQLIRRGTGSHGVPVWLIHDQARNQFFQIGWAEAEMLRHWRTATLPAQLMDKVNLTTPLHITEIHIGELANFLQRNELVRVSHNVQVAQLQAKNTRNRQGWGHRLLHSYLFFRIPLIQPDRFLQRALPYVAFMFSPLFMTFMVVAGMVGLFLTTRQWDEFMHSWPQFQTGRGVVITAGTLVMVKIFHELGHAFTACRYGCHVPTIGIAFLVMWPILYTDVGEAWRLDSPRQRLAIGLAGVVTELMIAVVATLAWHVVTDPDWRATLFIVATVGWLGAVAINLNPLIKFDGYHILADLLNLPNLQDRAFALGRHALRRVLFGLNPPLPETFSPPIHRILVGYAWATWFYRFFLFLSIAVVVYHFFFKLLGLFLMAVEIGWFIVRPLVTEIRIWVQHRQEVAVGAITWRFMVLLAMGSLLIWPWHEVIYAEALLQAEPVVSIHPTQAGRIDQVFVQEGQHVAQGEVLVTLTAPDLQQALAQVEQDLAIATLHQSDNHQDDPGVWAHTLAATQAKQNGLRTRQAQLVKKAPFPAIVKELSPMMRPGVWVASHQRLLLLVGHAGPTITAFLEEDARYQIPKNAPAIFYPDDPGLSPFPVRLQKIELLVNEMTGLAYVSAPHGGTIPAHYDAKGLLRPDMALTQARFTPNSPSSLPVVQATQRGVVRIPSTKTVVYRRILNRILALLIREFTF